MKTHITAIIISILIFLTGKYLWGIYNTSSTLANMSHEDLTINLEKIDSSLEKLLAINEQSIAHVESLKEFIKENKLVFLTDNKNERVVELNGNVISSNEKINEELYAESVIGEEYRKNSAQYIEAIQHIFTFTVVISKQQDKGANG